MQKSHPSISYLFILNSANPQVRENLFYLPVMANHPSSFPPSLSSFLLYFDIISGDNFKYNTKNSYIYTLYQDSQMFTFCSLCLAFNSFMDLIPSFPLSLSLPLTILRARLKPHTPLLLSTSLGIS